MNLFEKDIHAYGATDVASIYNFYFKWLLGKLHDIFKFNNLPEHLDEEYLWNLLYLNGKVCFTEMKGKLRAVYGNLGGKENEFYMPTIYTVANPILGSKEVKIFGDDKDGVMVYLTKTDKTYNYLPGNTGGLYELIKTTATMLADNIVSINCAQINTRVQAVVTADSPSLRTSAELALKNLYAGKPWQVMTQDLVNSINVNPMSSSGSVAAISQLIELQQYILGQFFNAVGIKTNAVNKKERLITDEINSVDTFLAVSLDQIEETVTEGLEEVNSLFGENITIELNDILKPVIEEAEEQNEEISSGDNEDENVQETGHEPESEGE